MFDRRTGYLIHTSKTSYLGYIVGEGKLEEPVQLDVIVLQYVL